MDVVGNIIAKNEENAMVLFDSAFNSHLPTGYSAPRGEQNKKNKPPKTQEEIVKRPATPPRLSEVYGARWRKKHLHHLYHFQKQIFFHPALPTALIIFLLHQELLQLVTAIVEHHHISCLPCHSRGLMALTQRTTSQSQVH